MEDWRTIEQSQQAALAARARGDIEAEITLLDGCLELMIQRLTARQGTAYVGWDAETLNSAWTQAAPHSRERASLVSLAGQFGVEVMMFGDAVRSLEPLRLCYENFRQLVDWIDQHGACTHSTDRQEAMLRRRLGLEMPLMLAEAYNATGQTTLAAGLTREVDALSSEPADDTMYALMVYLTLTLNLTTRLQHRGQLQRALDTLTSRMRLQKRAPRWMREILAAKQTELGALTAGQFLKARAAQTMQLGWFLRGGLGLLPGILAGLAFDQMDCSLRAGRWDLAYADAARVLFACHAAGQGAQAMTWRTFGQLAEFAEADGRLWSAVLLRKLAVDLVHRVGLRLAREAPDLAGESDDEAEFLHADLARTLLDLSRVGEAAEVLQLRYRSEPAAAGPSLTNAEARAFTVIRQALGQVGSLRHNDTVSRLLQRAAGVVGIPPATSITLTPSESALAGAFAFALDLAEHGGIERDAAVQRLNAALEERDTASLPAAALRDTAQIFFIVARRGVTAIVRTTRGDHTIVLPEVDSPWINRFVIDTLRLVADSRADPHAQLRIGWTRLILPLIDRLEGVARLLIAAPGALHSLPWGALFDGERYLVERFSWIRATSPNVDLKCTPKRPVFAGFAATRGADGLEALGSSVLDEVNGAQTFMGGTVFVDHEYTAGALRSALSAANIVHIASHFVAVPGSLERSTLLLGDRRSMTLAQFLEADLKGIDLIVLSACNTGLASGAAVIDGDFAIDAAVLARGVRAAITTLWSVESAATATIVQSFFEEIHAGSDKDIAIASAQRAAIRGAVGEGRLRLPAFWACLTLSGNWLGWAQTV
jgi:CHAT domain-containing protein